MYFTLHFSCQVLAHTLFLFPFFFIYTIFLTYRFLRVSIRNLLHVETLTWLLDIAVGKIFDFHNHVHDYNLYSCGSALGVEAYKPKISKEKHDWIYPSSS